MATTPKHGGSRQGAGKKPLPEADVMKPVSIYMKPAQREKLQRLGGATWVRKKIDQAKE